ncbi:MAG: MerR family transcriptional regulator [Nocardioidaceae bacterium]
MHTQELAAAAGVNPQTLRYYERRGLLPDPPRTAAGYRTYPQQSVVTVRFIKRAQELGFRLNDIDELLHLAEGGPTSCDKARTLATERMAGIDAKISDLQRMRDSLQHLVASCSRPHAERECPLLDAIDTAALSNNQAKARR